MIGISRRHGSCSVAMRQETVVGVGVWLPPNAYPLGLLDNLRMIPAMRGALSLSREQQGILRAMEAVAENHFPAEPVWYLQAFGIAPGLQGLGIGSRLLRYHLNRADQEGVPCYLETSGDANIRFYERAGFVVRDSGLHLPPASITAAWSARSRPERQTPVTNAIQPRQHDLPGPYGVLGGRWCAAKGYTRLLAPAADCAAS